MWLRITKVAGASNHGYAVDLGADKLYSLLPWMQGNKPKQKRPLWIRRVRPALLALPCQIHRKVRGLITMVGRSVESSFRMRITLFIAKRKTSTLLGSLPVRKDSKSNLNNCESPEAT